MSKKVLFLICRPTTQYHAQHAASQHSKDKTGQIATQRYANSPSTHTHKGYI